MPIEHNPAGEKQLFSAQDFSQLIITSQARQFQPAAPQEKAINLRLIGF